MIPQVTGYKGFNSYGNRPYSAYKPGQFALERTYYDKATTNAPDGKAVLSNFERTGTVYGKGLCSAVKQEHFLQRGLGINGMIPYEMAHNPQLFQHTKLARKARNQGKDPMQEFHNMSLQITGTKAVRASR